MSRDYFLKILKYLRFDDKPNRVRSGPRAASIRQVFKHFANQCQKKYTCKFSLTVDEQLMPLKSRCSFVIFMPNKPDKYGVKFWVLADMETKYCMSQTLMFILELKKKNNVVVFLLLNPWLLIFANLSKERVTT